MITINGNNLTIENTVEICRNHARVTLAEAAKPGIRKSRDFVERILKENRVVYGITTGVGELANTLISPEEAEVLQENLIRSHATNVGEPFTEEIVRGIILLRANALAKGFSGIRLEVVEMLLELLNADVHPFIPSQGSVGASGDLSPLSHLALIVAGEGECLVDGKRVPTPMVLKQKGLKPFRLGAKEGLALINGTQVMAAIGCHLVRDAEDLLKHAQIAGAMSLEALKGTSKALDPKIHALRPHPGQIKVAENISRLVENSKIIASHKDCEKVQDAYTLRCIPQVYGAIIDTINRAKETLQIEINSATDNPLIFADQEEVISGGNFHGEPLAFILDFLGIALSEIGNISERTLDRLVNPHVSGLPPFLAPDSGTNSGFMISQYTAAALVSENKVLAHPASVDSIPTSAGQEDHVSMGSISAKHGIEILKNVQHVIGIELLAAAQGMEFHHEEPGNGTGAALGVIRQSIPFMVKDRVMYLELEKINELLKSGRIVKAVEEAVGAIH